MAKIELTATRILVAMKNNKQYKNKMNKTFLHPFIKLKIQPC